MVNFRLDFRVLVKTGELDGCRLIIKKMKKNKKNNSLKHWATGFEVLR